MKQQLRNVFRPLAFIALVLTAVLVALGCKGEPPKPGQEAFDAANAKITVYENKLGFGSDAEAAKFAERFSTEIVKREAEAFEGGKDAENSVTTQGKWISFCQNHADAVVLLVHVPNLDTYEGENRKALAELVWEAATELSAPLRAGKDKKVVVALRGNLLFGAVAQGAPSGKPIIEAGTVIATESLYPYFQ